MSYEGCNSHNIINLNVIGLVRLDNLASLPIFRLLGFHEQEMIIHEEILLKNSCIIKVS